MFLMFKDFINKIHDNVVKLFNSPLPKIIIKLSLINSNMILLIIYTNFLEVYLIFTFYST
jgi:energy-converting hydrogenase Eha subunit C